MTVNPTGLRWYILILSCSLYSREGDHAAIPITSPALAQTGKWAGENIALALRQRFPEKSKAECRDIARRALRAQCWYEQNKDATAELVVKQTGSSLEYVHAYMGNEHYRLNLDQYPISVERAWSWMGEMGITDGLIRFSAGLDDAEDLIADFGQAFAQL